MAFQQRFGPAFLVPLVLAVAGLVAAALAVPLASGSQPATAHGTRLPQTIALPAGFQPEGITSGPGTTFYTGSRATGAIYRGDLRTGQGKLLVPASAGASSLGMQYDATTGLLWVAGGPTGLVTAYDGRSGRVVGRYSFPGSGFLNDLVVTRSGVYVTDSQVARLAVVPFSHWRRTPPPAAAARTLPLSGELVYTAGFNANGIRQLPTGALVVVQSSTGGLFRVDPRTGVTDELVVTGPELTGGDGLEIVDGILYVVRGLGGNEVVALDLSRDGRGAVVVGSLLAPTLDVPTTVTFAADRLWAVNGRFSTPPTPTTSYWVTQVRPLR